MEGMFSGGGLFDGGESSGFEVLHRARRGNSLRHDGDNSDIIPISLYTSEPPSAGDEAFDLVVGDGRQTTGVSPLDPQTAHPTHPSAHRPQHPQF